MSELETQVIEFKRLVAETRTLLKHRPAWMSYTVICKATGLGYSWLNKFACATHQPATTKVTVLHRYLTEQKKAFETEATTNSNEACFQQS